MTVAVSANTDWYLYNYQHQFLTELHRRYRSVVLAPDTGYLGALESVADARLSIPSSRGYGVRSAIAQLRCYLRAYRSFRPLVAHHFTLKTVAIGTAAAALCGVPHVVNSITGLGHIYSSQRRRDRLLRVAVLIWLRTWGRLCRKVTYIVQNRADAQVLRAAGVALSARITVTRGSGVDVARYGMLRPHADPRDDVGVVERRIRFLFAGRLLREKGVADYADAARIARGIDPSLQFLIAGAPDSGNPRAITPAELMNWTSLGNIELLGHVADIPTLLESVDVVVHPSYYREGVPKILLEAAAAGKASIATRWPGCEDAVTDGVTGLLVPPRDPDSLAAAMLDLAADAQRRTGMGARARRLAEQEFAVENVIRSVFSAYDDGSSGIRPLPTAARSSESAAAD